MFLYSYQLAIPQYIVLTYTPFFYVIIKETSVAKTVSATHVRKQPPNKSHQTATGNNTRTPITLLHELNLPDYSKNRTLEQGQLTGSDTQSNTRQ